MFVTDIRLLSVQDYHRMVEARVLAPDERVELISGQLYKMAAKGTAHSAAVTRIERVLKARLSDRVLLRFQDPIALDDYSEPEPDIAVVKVDPLDYEEHHPTPTEVYLLIEVADTTLRLRSGVALSLPKGDTLKRDRELKAPAYAQSGIQDYWILDVNQRQLYVFRSPTVSPEPCRRATGYTNEFVLSDSDVISPLTFLDCQIAVVEMLRKQ